MKNGLYEALRILISTIDWRALQDMLVVVALTLISLSLLAVVLFVVVVVLHALMPDAGTGSIAPWLKPILGLGYGSSR